MRDSERPLRFIINSVRGRFSYLFVALLLFLALHPYLEGSRTGELFFILLFAAIPAAGIWAVGYQRPFRFIGIVLGLPTLLWCVELFTGIHIMPAGVGKFIALTFYLYTTLVILVFVLNAKKVTSDILYGAVCVYLMFGMTWMLGYRIIEHFQPGSFVVGGEPLSGGGFEVVDLIYYSFVTLTTLGYGDILPVSGPARSLAVLEATCGVLYLAILIARLVSLYASSGDEEPAQQKHSAGD
jgi:hypothetical protein